jgi:hypothetical protein
MPTDKLSTELLAVFIDGHTTAFETDQVCRVLAGDTTVFEEFIHASKISWLSDVSENAEDSDSSGWQFAAGTASAIAGGAGLSGYLSHLVREASALGNSEEISENDDRFPDQTDSKHENLNYLTMDTFNQPQEFNPIQQQYDDTCAIKSQQLILNDFGVPVTENQLVNQAEQLNIYSPGSGTSPQDVGELLMLNGVDCTQHENATVYDLTSALAQGQKVIIGVDSGELWNNGILSPFINQATDHFVGEQADHALIVAGIDTTNPNDVQVILTDPGTGEEAARYPMEQFLDAWQDSGNFMVTTDAPAPLAYNPEMINFDYDEGHIPMIGAMPYEYFDQTILPLSHGLNEHPVAMELLNTDFDGMIGGEISALSPELVNTLAQIPDFNDLGIDVFSAVGYSFGSSRMADYYNGWAEQHDKPDQYDIDHGNLDNDQNFNI